MITDIAKVATIIIIKETETGTPSFAKPIRQATFTGSPITYTAMAYLPRSANPADTKLNRATMKKLTDIVNMAPVGADTAYQGTPTHQPYCRAQQEAANAAMQTET